MKTSQSQSPESVPAFNESPHSPFAVGSCPRAGWYAIDCVSENPIPDDPRLLSRGESPRNGQAREHVEKLDADALHQLVANFKPSESAGNGIPINDNHLHHKSAVTDKAKGFVRALASDGINLYAWLDLTAVGHAEINAGEFWACSTEYPYSHFEKTHEDEQSISWAPRLLGGLALTNNPDHKDQVGLCSYHTQKQNPISMRKTHAIAALHNAAAPDKDKPAEQNTKPDKDEPAEQNSSPAEKSPASNKEEPVDKNAMHSEGGAEDWSDFVEEVAKILGASADETGDALLTRLRQMKADYNALAAAGDSGATAQHRRPRHPHASSLSLNTGVTPKFSAGQRESALSQHCSAAVASHVSSLGRNLSNKEHSRIWKQAEANFNN